MFKLGAFAIIWDHQDRVLLCHRRDIDAWNLPGGGIEQDELPTEAVIREVLEETGLHVEIDRLAGIYLKPEDDELVFSFICQVIRGELKSSEECDRSEYFEAGRLPPNTSPKQVERIEDAVQNTELVFRRQVGIGTRQWLRELGLLK